MADDDLFTSAMDGVKPLDREKQRVDRPRPQRRVYKPKEAAPIVLDSFGDHSQGLAEGVAPDELRKLETGETKPTSTLDLHGCGEEEARQLVRDYVRKMLRSSNPCIRIVHGRGLRSAAGPVLKAGVVHWLTELPTARWVSAFTTAGVYGANGGATVVLLKRRN